MLATCLAMSTTTGAALAYGIRQPAEPSATIPAGTGVICIMAIFNAVAEVGRRCFPGQDPEFQAELGRAVDQIDQYVLRNSAATPADLERFKQEQANVGEPSAAVCRSEVIGMYRNLARRGTASLRSETEALVARPGPPEWGDCL
ncbi:hypothetical protein [Sphingosinicella sp. YJ22]|uniref:hypothetical protein n=1 Tax=Sphingosinicella sp. YJ22 TaxID=1104780 RepID=UPI001407CC95|nr:hypothetical protein [Sphingosinicella sp. YJ22]